MYIPVSFLTKITFKKFKLINFNMKKSVAPSFRAGARMRTQYPLRNFDPALKDGATDNNI